MLRSVLLTSIILALVAGGSTPVVAVPCAVDDVPAATLLLPYFEVDFTTADGATTLFSVATPTRAPGLRWWCCGPIWGFPPWISIFTSQATTW